MSLLMIIGAKSDIAQAVARKYAENGYDLCLAARASEELKPFATDLEIRTSQRVEIVELDILDFESHQGFYSQLAAKPDGVLVAVGYNGEQLKAQSDFQETQLIINSNYTGVVSILNIIADDFEKRSHGFIIGISSVAGDRGRKKNFIYGSAKAGLTAYLSGLRNRLNNANVNVLTVKPGFVATKMTEDMDLPGLLTAQPEEVASDVFKSQEKSILYTRWMWRWIMLIIKFIPEFQFKKMDI